MGYLIDTNVLIQYVAEEYSQHDLLKLDIIMDDVFNLSVISKIETLGFSGNTAEEMAKMSAFIGAAHVIGLSDAVVSQTILLRKTYKIKTPDAIIAATAIVQNLILVTHDSGFQKINDLQVVEPIDI
jgi:hypothetical protein